MKKTILLLLVLIPFAAEAQGLLKNAGKSVDELVPQGWSHTGATGDLNKDGIVDLVVSATPDFEEKLKVREDGYVYNFNQPVLGIFFGTRDGQFKCWKQYRDVIPARESEEEMPELSIEITKRGTLRIEVGMMYSAGSSYVSKVTYTFRYQDKDFFLIGKDEDSFSRMSGEQEIFSYNFLTCRMQAIKSNVFDESVRSVETWKRLDKMPLRRMGGWTL